MFTIMFQCYGTIAYTHVEPNNNQLLTDHKHVRLLLDKHTIPCRKYLQNCPYKIFGFDNKAYQIENLNQSFLIESQLEL